MSFNYTDKEKTNMDMQALIHCENVFIMRMIAAFGGEKFSNEIEPQIQYFQDLYRKILCIDDSDEISNEITPDRITS